MFGSWTEWALSIILCPKYVVGLCFVLAIRGLVYCIPQYSVMIAAGLSLLHVCRSNLSMMKLPMRCVMVLLIITVKTTIMIMSYQLGLLILCYNVVLI